jgi:hypothetical protein
MSPPPKISRRAVTTGALAGAAAAVIAGAVYEVPRLLRHRARGEYAELVNHLDDPDRAAIVGKAMPEHAVLTKEELSELKTALARTSVSDLAIADARDDRLKEADGWVLPATVATLCALAAQSL